MSFNIRGFGMGKDSKISDCHKLLARENPLFVAFQETKCNCVDRNWVSLVWGSQDFDFIQKEKIGKLGGLLLVWDFNSFSVEQSFVDDYYIAVKGKWVGKNVETIIVNIYGPHDDTNKQKMWSSLVNFVGAYDLDWVLCGDFNEVRDKTERQNCQFVERRATWFNEFIENAKLIDVPMGGKKFMRICDNGIKFSKLDQFLVSEKFIQTWGDISVLALERKLSDHCPIVLRDIAIDYGPKSAKVFDEWLDLDGEDKIIKECWDQKVEGSRADFVFRKKTQKC
ncbi:uncharacterized protein [Rutidosis leptorrhynchoides]|uniref:uncharacterized protein n=1 Tax=Rutidosis leptorrhynchoides TaxID=125765 RepID=UPI003A99161B